MTKTIKDILMNGINLNLESVEEEQHYILKMLEYFEEETDFTVYLKVEGTLEIETLDMRPAMEILLINSTLFMVPYHQDVFEVFTEVLKFISSRHLDVIKDFRGTEETKIQSIEEMIELNDARTEEQEKKQQEEPSSEDDYEWI